MKNIPRIFLKEYIVYMLRRVQNKEGRKFRTLRCRRNVCLHCGVLKCGVPVLLESCNSEARAPSDLHSHFAHNVSFRGDDGASVQKAVCWLFARVNRHVKYESEQNSLHPLRCIRYTSLYRLPKTMLCLTVLCVSFLVFAFSFLSRRKLNTYIFISLQVRKNCS